MKISKLFAVLFGLLGIGLMIFAVGLSLNSVDAEPVLVEAPAAARDHAEAMLDAVCAGDYVTAGNMLQGQPSLGVDRPAADDVGVLIWEAFMDSTSYEFIGDCYATDSGVAWDVRFTGLDMESVTGSLRGYSQSLLEQRVEEAIDMSLVYDENNEYREDVVMEVLVDAAKMALENDAQYYTTEFTMNLVYQQGQWWIVPEDALLEAISGGILG